ncbi:MAG: hypothetical protein BZ138_05995 [Methanosphaera sp. rholeuAM270]|nr:MAG: hypothetical protein BZ138_05995 [Methanosphaera sp. rholeuAM270]
MTLDCPNISLKKGSKGETVKELQTWLKAKGYYTRQVDGDYGNYTVEAVKKFQKQYSLTVDGWFGPLTCAKYKAVIDADNKTEQNTTASSTSTSTSLFNCTNTSLKRGSTGEEVKKLQSFLKELGYYTREVDGDFGQYTEAAVKEFQRKTGHTADGWFGPKTCASANSLYKEKHATTTSTAEEEKWDITNPVEQNVRAKITFLEEVLVLPEELMNSLAVSTTTTTTSTNEEGETETTTKTSSTTTSKAPTTRKCKGGTLSDVKSVSLSCDNEGLSYECTIETEYSFDKLLYIQRFQKAKVLFFKGSKQFYTYEGYVNEISIERNEGYTILKITLNGYAELLNISLEYTATDKKSVLIKNICEMVGLKAEVDTTGLVDDVYTIILTESSTSTSGGGGGLTSMSGNDCTGTYELATRTYNVNDSSKHKVGNSSANYAQDTASMTGKQALLDIYKRFVYSLYSDNRTCPRNMWNKSGSIRGNCADISRLCMVVGQVHGLNIGIHHMYNHYYNLVEVDGKTYRFDCCCKSSGSYQGEVTNTLTMRGGPWSSG